MEGDCPRTLRGSAKALGVGSACIKLEAQRSWGRVKDGDMKLTRQNPAGVWARRVVHGTWYRACPVHRPWDGEGRGGAGQLETVRRRANDQILVFRVPSGCQ